MDKIIEKIKKLVKDRASEEDWNYHIKLVVKNTLALAKRYKVDERDAELAALLHDIGRLPYSDQAEEKHHILGAEEAGKILKRLKYPEERIKAICSAILSHRGSVPPKTVLEKIIANADALSHFDILPVFYYWRAGRFSVEEITEWIEEKYKRNFRKKLTLPEARKMARKKYKLNMEILKNLHPK